MNLEICSMRNKITKKWFTLCIITSIPDFRFSSFCSIGLDGVKAGVKAIIKSRTEPNVISS